MRLEEHFNGERWLNRNDINILSWNILQGGGSRTRSILNKILRKETDIVILQEFRNGGTGFVIRKELLDIGFIHQMVIDLEPEENGILVASCLPFNGSHFPHLEWNRVIRMELENSLVIYGMYFPQKEKKKELFEFILERYEMEKDLDVMFIGDFNTGKHHVDEEGATFHCPEYLDIMEEVGLKDGFRDLHGDKQEYSWFSNHGIGFRTDHVFHDLKNFKLKKCVYDHKVRERGLSDHSILEIKIRRKQ